MSTSVTNKAITPDLHPEVLSPGQEIASVPRPQQDPLVHAGWYSAEQVRKRVQLVQSIYREVMQEDTHFGKIPGCKKPSLYKAGSEQLLMTFRLAVRPKVQEIVTPDAIRYRVFCEITHAPTGMYLGTGVGECSSDESKYKWREAVCIDEWNVTTDERRREKWIAGQRGNYTIKQVRQEPADVANTILKMAKKRAQIDATLTVTAASDIFTQDVEDMDNPVDTDAEGYDQRTAEDREPPAKQPVAMPTRKSAPVQQQQQPLTPEPSAQRTAPPQQRPATPPPPPRVESPAGRKISEAQAKRFFGICMANGITKPEQKQYLTTTWGISNDRDILVENYEACIAWAQGEKF